MDPENTDVSQEQLIVASMEQKLRQLTVTPFPGAYTICPFPDVLAGIDDGIRLPQLASFGPCHYRKGHLLPFEKHKHRLLYKFLSRTQSLQIGLPFYVRKLNNLKDEIKRCYSPKFSMPPDNELVEMMISDGSFTVEIFLEYDERTDLTPPSSTWPILTLISDMLKLENQLPFFVLKKLFKWSNIGQRATPRKFSDFALRFLSQAFCRSSEMVYPDVQEPKHLLDLFRRSLLPATNSDPQSCERYDRRHSIQSVKDLRSVGITVRQKTAKSLLEIDFRKFQIPPLALKIPPLAIDDFTNAVLVNCVALEQCFPNQSKHFTAYACFMSCLVKQPEDVGYLRSADIIKGASQDEKGFINMLNSMGRDLSVTLRECYLWKQFREIHGYYNSNWAWIRRTLVQYKDFIMYFTILQVVLGTLSWRLPAHQAASPAS